MGIDNNLAELKRQINDRAKLVVVTKTRSLKEINQAIFLGVSDIGENRIHEALEKYPHIGSSVKWHMIGHLQTNKVKKVVEIFDMIQSVDSEKLAREIDKRSRNVGKVMSILVEVNIGEEPQKYGVSPDDVLSFIENIAHLKNIKVLGLMCMAPFVEPEETRQYFKRMKSIFDKIKVESISNVEMKYLSMGMSNDYKVALEEGSNMIRIGTALFS